MPRSEGRLQYRKAYTIANLGCSQASSRSYRTGSAYATLSPWPAITVLMGAGTNGCEHQRKEDKLEGEEYEFGRGDKASITVSFPTQLYSL